MARFAGSKPQGLEAGGRLGKCMVPKNAAGSGFVKQFGLNPSWLQRHAWWNFAKTTIWLHTSHLSQKMRPKEVANQALSEVKYGKMCLFVPVKSDSKPYCGLMGVHSGRDATENNSFIYENPQWLQESH